MTRAWCVLAAIMAVAGCTEVGTDPEAVVSIQFDALPYPAIALGDTLRDSSGVPVPVRAVAFNADNEPIPGAPIEYFVSDTVSLRIDPATGLIIADAVVSDSARLNPPRVFARIGALSPFLSLILTPAPAVVRRSADSIPIVKFFANPLSGEVGVVVSYDSAGTLRPVRGWLASYALTFRGATLTDTLSAYPVGDQNRFSRVDTTDASGVASRRIRIRAAPLPGNAVDSIVVHTTVRYRGGDISGSPVRQVVRFHGS